MRLTRKQIALIQAIRDAGDDNVADFDQVLEAVDYETSKDSLQFSIRALIKRGIICKGELELRRERFRRVLYLTELGHSIAARYCKENTATY